MDDDSSADQSDQENARTRFYGGGNFKQKSLEFIDSRWTRRLLPTQNQVRFQEKHISFFFYFQNATNVIPYEQESGVFGTGAK